MSLLNVEAGLIENATLFYAKIKTPSFKYQSTTEKEYAVTALVDKATAKLWNKTFPKQKAKEIDFDDFKEKYGEEYAIGADEQFTITLKKAAQYKHKETGELVELPDAYKPRAFLDDGNGELEDITFTKLIGNGSKGTVQFEVNENSFGTFAGLIAVRVDELVVVEQSGGDSSVKYNVLGKVKSLAENPVKKDVEEVVDKSPTTAEDDQW